MSDWLGWHFLSNDRCLRYPPHTLVEPGQTLTVEGLPKLCEHGLHASRRAIDALGYAPGPIACRVRLSGKIIIEDSDKACATERTVLWLADATNMLHEFACWCAEQALLREREGGGEPDPRSWAAIEAKRKWLRGEITNEELAAARAAARDAARAAARDAAWAAAWAAARAAAWDAARAAAWDAAWDATWDAARDAAWDAARDAAWDAARADQNSMLEKMLFALRGDGREEEGNDK